MTNTTRMPVLTLYSSHKPAIDYLWHQTHLHRHPRAGQAYDRVNETLDLEVIRDDAYNWSFGERIMLDLARTIAYDGGDFQVTKLTWLDDETRLACLHAISLWLMRGKVA